MNKVLSAFGLLIVGIAVGLITRGLYDRHRQDIGNVIGKTEDKIKAVYTVLKAN